MTAHRQKIHDPVKYPEFIDLTPYTTIYRDYQQQQSKAAANGDSKSDVNGSSHHLSRLANK